jgi:hypothetical protein
MLSIEDMVWNSQRTLVSASAVGRSVKAREPRGRFACAGAGFGMTSKGHLFKGTFGVEMHLMP